MTDIITGYHSPHIGFIKFNTPVKRNALSLEMWQDLPALLAKFSDNPKLRVLIVSGADGHFSAGGDISEFEALFSTPEAAMEFGETIDAAFDVLVNFRVPTIAQVRGGAVGGGCGLALACDVRMGDETAFFAITPAKLGIIYPFPEIARLVTTVGIAMAKDMLFSARIIEDKEAYKIGLLNQLLEAERLEEEVLNYARSIAEKSPNSQTVTKHILAYIEAGNTQASEQINAETKKAFLSDDFKEGYRSFLEKRKAEF